MKYRLLIFEIAGFIFVSVVGTLLHFAYEYFDYSTVAAVISPINESTWEHLKLLFFPFLFYTLFEYLVIGKKYNNFIYYKAISVLIGLFTILAVFYLYTGIIGRSFVIVDIILFYFSVFITYQNSYRLIKQNPIYKNYNNIGAFIFLLLIGLFVSFTFAPPAINLFQSPI